MIANTTRFGELDSEKLANDNRVTREIVKEINRFGINERQRLLLIYLLSLELENIEYLQNISQLTREFLKEEKALLIDESET